MHRARSSLMIIWRLYFIKVLWIYCDRYILGAQFVVSIQLRWNNFRSSSFLSWSAYKAQPTTITADGSSLVTFFTPDSHQLRPHSSSWSVCVEFTYRVKQLTHPFPERVCSTRFPPCPLNDDTDTCLPAVS